MKTKQARLNVKKGSCFSEYNGDVLTVYISEAYTCKGKLIFPCKGERISPFSSFVDFGGDELIFI